MREIADIQYDFFDYIVVGSGFSGTTCARMLAEKGYKVLVLEKRKHIAGNMYDYFKNGILIHKYGPHIIMTDNQKVYDFINKYDETITIDVKMETRFNNNNIPLPINLNGIKKIYDNKTSKMLIDTLIHEYGMNSEINILDMLNHKDKCIRLFAHDIYQQVFIGYNEKMWGLKPEQIDKSVVGRVPIRINYNDIRSKKKYNIVPKKGYTQLFNNILSHHNIKVITDINAVDHLMINNDSILFHGKKIKVIYTGPLDELFSFKYGELPYRSVRFVNKKVTYHDCFSGLALTYPTKYKKFRTSDMCRVTGNNKSENTVLVSEYADNYNRNGKNYNTPAYPILNEDSSKIYYLYKNEAEKVKNLYCIGRLAEFKYYDMSQVIEAAFCLIKKMEE